MRRGDVVIAAAQGEYGKPRPAVVVQSDVVQQFDTVALALLTTTGIEAPAIRPIIAPSATNGVKEQSEVMIDKIQPVRLARIGAVVGRLSDDDMERVGRSLAFFFGLAD